jgi:hypothetical protein
LQVTPKRSKLNPRDQTSILIVAQMDELFVIDEKSRNRVKRSYALLELDTL